MPQPLPDRPPRTAARDSQSARRGAISALLCAASLAWAPALAQSQPDRARLEGSSLDGQPFSLAALRGKVVVVVFWSTACAVCRDMLPELRANQAGWRGKPFQLVTVSADPSRQDALQYQQLLERLLPTADRFPSLWRGEPGHQDSFGKLPTLPTSFVIDREGRVVDRYSGRIPPEAWDRVAELLP